jgi:hypothetical protein
MFPPSLPPPPPPVWSVVVVVPLDANGLLVNEEAPLLDELLLEAELLVICEVEEANLLEDEELTKVETSLLLELLLELELEVTALVEEA